MTNDDTTIPTAYQPERTPPGDNIASLLERCRMLGPAEQAVIVRQETQPVVLAVAPESTNPKATWIFAATKGPDPSFTTDHPALFQWQSGDDSGAWIVAVKLVSGETPVTAYFLLHMDKAEALEAADRLACAELVFASLEMQAVINGLQNESEQLRAVARTIRSLAEHDRFNGVCLALCNLAASSWDAERASLGILAGRDIRLVAMSHTEHLQKKSSLARSLEAVMEESLDQDVEIVHPSTGYDVIARVTRGFAESSGIASIVSVPIRRMGEPFAVLTLERDDTPTIGELAALRLLADAVSSPLWMAWRHRRFPGRGLIQSLREFGAAIVGPRHTWAKLTAIAAAAAIGFFLIVPGTYRVVGTARIEATERRVVPAPFDGYIEDAVARVGDAVEAGSPLGSLDTTDLLLRLGSMRAELDGHTREASLAARERKTAEAQIASAQADRVRAEIEFVERQLELADLVAPARGVVITGELQRSIGAPVATGDVLFEVAPLESLRVDTFVREDQISDLPEGSLGSLTLASRPDDRIPIALERIDPVAELRDGRNVFRVRTRLLEQADWLRPGMEGVARLDVGKRPYPWIWTRRAVNWVRMRLWI